MAVFALADLLVENDETVSITFLDGTGYQLTGDRNAELTIFDTGAEAPAEDAWRIAIFASDAYASEIGPNKGEFLFVRSGHSDLSQPLTVWFEISGTATYNADYTGIDATYDTTSGKWRGFVTFEAGQTHITLDLTPIVDTVTETTETVVITLLPTTATTPDGEPLYTVGDVDSATVRIADFSAGMPETPRISGDQEMYEGREFTLHLDAHDATVEQWEITWGDGTRSVLNGNATEAKHFYADGDAQYEITVVAVTSVTAPGEPGGPLEGLSHGYWKNHTKDWVFYKTSDNYEAIFGVKGSTKPGTLLEALKKGGGGIIALWRESTAAILNASHPNLNYRYSIDEIITMVRTAYATGEYEKYKDILETENTREGDIKKGGSGGDTPPSTEIVNVTLKHDLFVRNVAPILEIKGATEAKPGSVYELNLNSHDPGDDTIQYWMVNWGDGSEPERLEGNPSKWTHVYAAIGNYTITATATDEDGSWNANSVDVTIRQEVQTEWIKLIEDDRFVTEYRISFNVPADGKAMVLDIRNLQFDGRSEGMINDAFEIALVDKDGNPLVATIKTTRDGFLNISEGAGTLLAAGALYDSGAGRIILDLSRITAGTEATLIVRLVNNDTDTKTSVELNPVLSFIASPFGTDTYTTPQENPGNRQIVDFKHIQSVTSSIGIAYGTTTFNEQKDILRAGITLTNSGTYQMRGPILVGIRNISDPSVSAVGYDGVTPNGMIYFDVSHFAFSGSDSTFDPAEVIRGLDLQFLNPNHVQFDYELVVLAHINEAPTFVSTPKTEVKGGNEYTYDSRANDPENDTLRYEKVSGPEGMMIDAKTGKITWNTTTEDEGVHAVVIRVYDTFGLYGEQEFTVNVTAAINRPPYFTSTPGTEAFVGSIYHYQTTADDPDGDDLTFRLVSAVRTSDGVSLDTYHATHHLTVSEGGMVTWNPPAELAGKTITVVLEVSDGKGGTALQEYLIGVHADPVNNPPVIVTTPTTQVTLPNKKDEDATGAVTPGSINLTLDAGNKSVQTVEINIENQQLLAADIVFIVDESGSMSYGHTWIQNMVKGFEEKFGVMGINVKYALVGYADGGSGDLGRIITLNSQGAWGDSTEMWNACGTLRTSGGFEDGYSAVDFALNNLTFREGAARHFILLTDEPRDVGNRTIDMESTVRRLVDNKVTLHGIVSARFTDSSNQNVLGGRANGTSFISEPGGEYAENDGLMPIGRDRTVTEYVDLIFHPDIDGTCWAISEMNRNDLDRSRSFTNAFVDTLIWDVLSEFEIDVVSSNPDVQIVNITGIQKIDRGKLVFEVEITGDGNAHQFDLEFVNVRNDNTVIGTIPCSVRTGYVYDVDAIDADGDTLEYMLVGESHGATINAQTGVLVWDPAVPGDYTFTVRVTDGRGGEETQTWTVHVVDPSADNHDPTLQQVENKTLNVGESYDIPMLGSDVDGDALRYFLVMNPAEGLVYPDNLTIDRATGVINWTPTADQVGTYKIKVQVVDGLGGVATTEFTIKVVLPESMINHPPVIESEPALVGSVDKTYLYQIKATDPDGHALTYKLMYGPDGMVVDAKTGILVWTPKYDQVGQFPIVIRVSDGQGGYAHQEFVLNIQSENEAPTITSVPKGPIALGTPWTYQVTATDPNGDVLTYTLDKASLANGLTIDAATGLISWTPDTTGKFDVLITVDDGRGGTAMQGFTVEITEAVAPPEITSIPKGPAYIGEEWTYVVTTDQPAGTYTLSLDADSIARGITLDGDTLRWTPNAAGDAPIKLTLTDQYGGTYTQTFTITARAKAIKTDPPTISSEPIGPAYVGEEWTYQIVATDPAGKYALSYYQVIDGDVHRIVEGGLLKLTWNESGSEKITIRVENEQGAWIEQTFTLQIVDRPVYNDPPVITSIPTGPATVGDKYEYQVVAHDPNGDTLTYSIDQASYDRGLRIDATTGKLTWNPEQVGSFEIAVTVTDSHGDGMIQTFTLDTVAKPVQSLAPVITSQPKGPAWVGEEWAYQITAHDPDGDNFILAVVDADGNVLQTLANGILTWTPNAAGEQSFIIRATDAHGFWSEQAFTINATSKPTQNDPPVITSIPTGPAYVDERYEYRVNAYDPNGDALTFHLDRESIDRGITIGADGRLAWIPETIGSYAITVIVRDTAGNERTQSFELPVAVRNTETPPPTFTSTPTGPAYVGQEWSYTPIATTQDGSNVTFYLVSEDGQTVTPIDRITWTPDAPGDRTFIIRAEGADGSSIDQTVIVTAIVAPMSVDPPTFTSIPTGPAFVCEQYTYYPASSKIADKAV